MSLRDYAVNDYGLVLNYDTLKILARQLFDDYTEDAWNQDKYDFISDLSDMLDIECIGSFTGDMFRINDDGEDDYSCFEFFDEESVYYIAASRYPTLFEAAYTDMNGMIEDLMYDVKQYLPNDFPYRSFVRHIVGIAFFSVGKNAYSKKKELVSMISLCKYYHVNLGIIRELVDCLYNIDGCSDGGLLHVVIEDDNYDDDSIFFCLKQCLLHNDRRESALGKLICEELLKLQVETRRLLSGLEDCLCYKKHSCDKCFIETGEVEINYYDENGITFGCEVLTMNDKWEEIHVVCAEDTEDHPDIVSAKCPFCHRYNTTIYYWGDPVATMNFCPYCGNKMSSKENVYEGLY